MCIFWCNQCQRIVSRSLDDDKEYFCSRSVQARCPKVKKLLWGGEMWADGYYAGTVGKHGNEDMIGNYVKGQGGTYQKRYSDYQLSLF